MILIKSSLKLYATFLIMTLVMTSCLSPEEIQNGFLRKLNIDGQNDFEGLETCEQIDIYTTMASKLTDVDHMVTLAPIWMQETIAEQPREVVAQCVTNEITYLLTLWDENRGNKMEISYQIHGLFYMVDELGLSEFPEIDSLFYSVACGSEIYYKSQLVLILYTEKYGTSYIPDHDEMVTTLCGQIVQ